MKRNRKFMCHFTAVKYNDIINVGMNWHLAYKWRPPTRVSVSKSWVVKVDACHGRCLRPNGKCWTMYMIHRSFVNSDKTISAHLPMPIARNIVQIHSRDVRTMEWSPSRLRSAAISTISAVCRLSVKTLHRLAPGLQLEDSTKCYQNVISNRINFSIHNFSRLLQ